MQPHVTITTTTTITTQPKAPDMVGQRRKWVVH